MMKRKINKLKEQIKRERAALGGRVAIDRNYYS